VNKTELIDAVAKDSGLARPDTAKALESLLMTITKKLRAGEEVALTGFGKFSVSNRAARNGRNPATGQTIRIKATKTPKFTAGAPLKRAVSGKRTRRS
jgi:DNA-binding protein HU-beta